tara:strand:- start:7245 stop:8276 length:1032 start_codon:yes stop_codon:yes gene_type:complete
MKKENIIFIYPKLFTFIKTEFFLLSNHFNIYHINQNWSNKFLLPINLVIQFIYVLTKISNSKYILISFGGYWSFIPSILGKLFNKKVAIVVHGTDCVDFSEINYGNLRKPLMKWFTKVSYKFADIILPVSESLVYTENTYYCEKVLKFGYSYHLNKIETPYKVIHNGLIIDDWNVTKVNKEIKTFVTVMTDDQIQRKGAEIIIRAARELHDCKFYFAGTNTIDNAPSNVYFLGKLSPLELKEIYKNTQFYLQLSNFEGFGVAICEAMLCYCIPIVSNVNFLPSIVDDTGFIVQHRDHLELINLIKSNYDKNLDNLSIKARNRIINNFSINNRRDNLIETLNSL